MRATVPGAGARPALSPFAGLAFSGWLAVTATWWALAFAPLPFPQEWLARARAVCFGTLANGLPDRWGWMLLVLGPLSMLAFLAAVWGRDLARTARLLARRRVGLLLLLALGGGAAGAGAWVHGRVERARALDSTYLPAAGEPFPADYPRGGEPAPALALVDQHGARFDLAATRGRPAVVTFAFAHCATVCPVLVSTLHRSVGELPPGVAPAVVVVTLDPWRDTPASLPGLAAAWGLDRLPSAHALSGAVGEVEATRERWGVGAQRNLETGDIVHAALIFVVDAEGRLAYRLSNPPPDWLSAAIRRAAA